MERMGFVCLFVVLVLMDCLFDLFWFVDSICRFLIEERRHHPAASKQASSKKKKKGGKFRFIFFSLLLLVCWFFSLLLCSGDCNWGFGLAVLVWFGSLCCFFFFHSFTWTHRLSSSLLLVPVVLLLANLNGAVALFLVSTLLFFPCRCC